TQSANQLKQIGLALHAYHDANMSLPPPAISSPDGRPLLSWRVAILPYLGHDTLFRRFNLQEAWDSPGNRALLAEMPKVYEAPGAANQKSQVTFYRVFVGQDTVFPPTPRG